MPKNNREWAQRKIQSAIGNMEKAAGHLLNIAELYESEKVEYVSKNCYILIQAMAEIPDMLKTVNDEISSLTDTDYSPIFKNIDGYLQSISNELTTITNTIANEPVEKRESKTKGVIDSIMIITQGLTDLKRMF